MPNDTLTYKIRDSLYINLTDRCTLECQFCPKYNGTNFVHEFDLTLHERPLAEEIINQIGDPKKYKEIVFCGYGEPTLKLKVLLVIATDVKSKGGKVRINTDGLANLSNKKNVLPEMSNCIDALSISMNAQTEAVYNRHCQPALKGSFDAMLKFIELAPKYIDDVTATAIDGLEGVDIQACKKMAVAMGVKFRTRYLDHVG